MTDETETVQAVVDDLMARRCIVADDVHLVRLVALLTIKKLREEGQLPQAVLPLFAAAKRTGLWL